MFNLFIEWSDRVGLSQLGCGVGTEQWVQEAVDKSLIEGLNNRSRNCRLINRVECHKIEAILISLIKRYREPKRELSQF